MSKGRNNRLTGQIGEHLVCAQLGKIDLIATPFSGNVPTFDILAANELCQTVPIQVKSSRSNTWPSNAQTWMKLKYDPATKAQKLLGPADLSNPELIYVCVAIAPTGQQDRFFILTMRNLQQVCIDCYSRFMAGNNWKRPKSPESYDCRWSIDSITQFENNWDLIAKRLQADAPELAPVVRPDDLAA